MINIIWCFCKTKKRVRDPSEPDKRRKTSGAPVKRRNSISPAGIINRNSPEHSSRQSLPQLNTVPSISIIEAGLQESQIDAIEQHLQKLDDIPEDHEVVSIRPTGNSARKAQEALVRNSDETTTDMHVPGKLNRRDDRKTNVSSPTDDRSGRLDLDVDDQRACSGGSQRSTGSSGYGSLPPSPRTRPAIPRSEKTWCSKTLIYLRSNQLQFR
ncbi:uncharacterized protein LOC118424921 [Branchiostoma floridae]|uniref:Uncharacterized protein LOC118424921 n=1 Tax=Branchiostoma floridae TaxID=7739 RepID=A0A9J7LY50_BRAFL|nr:uncharacterized protein LOC118424921 [Branchiostoma floridae]